MNDYDRRTREIEDSARFWLGVAVACGLVALVAHLLGG